MNIRYNENRMDHFIYIPVSELSGDHQGKLNKVLKNAGRKMTTFLRHKPSGTLSNVGKVIYGVDNDFLTFFGYRDINDFITIVTTDNKERFAVFFKNNSEKYWVAAAQGHSGDLTRIENVEKYLLERVSDIPYLWHGTRSEYGDSIMKNGLSRCDRFHIHMIGSREHAFLLLFTMCLHGCVYFCCYLQYFCIAVCVFVVIYNTCIAVCIFVAIYNVL